MFLGTSSIRQTIYILVNPNQPQYGGVANYDFDIGDDYVEMTVTANLAAITAGFYQIPGQFNGLVMQFAGAPPTIQSATVTFGGVLPSGHISSWNLWASPYPGLEALVDATAMDPSDPGRIVVAAADQWRLNTQGVGWSVSGPGSYVMSMRANLTFVPAPGAVALLGLAGLLSRRRR